MAPDPGPARRALRIPEDEPFVDAPDMVSCRLTAMVIAYIDARYGEEVSDRAIARAGTTRDHAGDLRAWTSFATYNALWDAAVEVTGDPDIGREIGHFSITSRPLRYLLQIAQAALAIGSVNLGMRFLPDIINRTTRCVRYRLLHQVAENAVFEVTEPRDLPFNKARCDYRIGMLEALPTMSGIAPERVVVHHEQCMGNGYPACVYEIHCTPRAGQRSPRHWALIAGVVGAAAFLTTYVVAGEGLVLATIAASLGSVIAGLTGWNHERSRRLGDTITVLRQHQQEMIDTNAEAELRYEELKAAYRELERRSEELDRTREELARTDRLAAMGRLMSGIAHELNNPLAGVLSSAELIQRLDPDPQIAAMAHRIIEAVQRCRRLNRNMLDFSRQRPAEDRIVDLVDVVDATADFEAHALKMAGIDLSRRHDGGRTTVRGDAGQLQQVLVNLVENAIYELERQDGPRRIEIALRGGGDVVTLDVIDSGPGVPPGIRRRIFDPFFTTKRSGHGTGLGLSISHRIVSAHGGTLELVGGAGRGRLGGCHLRITLPADHVDVPPAGDGASDELSVSGPHRPLLRLLIVDDDEQVRTTIAKLLQSFGHDTVTAGNAPEARSLLEIDDDFDALLLDLRMPDENGIDLFRSLPAALRARALFMTGAMTDDETEDFVTRHEQRSLVKPFTYRELMDALRTLEGEPGSEDR